jgi:hypothetical protein
MQDCCHEGDTPQFISGSECRPIQEHFKLDTEVTEERSNCDLQARGT